MHNLKKQISILLFLLGREANDDNFVRIKCDSGWKDKSLTHQLCFEQIVPLPSELLLVHFLIARRPAIKLDPRYNYKGLRQRRLPWEATPWPWPSPWHSAPGPCSPPQTGSPSGSGLQIYSPCTAGPPASKKGANQSYFKPNTFSLPVFIRYSRSTKAL